MDGWMPFCQALDLFDKWAAVHGPGVRARLTGNERPPQHLVNAYQAGWQWRHQQVGRGRASEGGRRTLMHTCADTHTERERLPLSVSGSRHPSNVTPGGTSTSCPAQCRQCVSPVAPQSPPSCTLSASDGPIAASEGPEQSLPPEGPCGSRRVSGWRVHLAVELFVEAVGVVGVGGPHWLVAGEDQHAGHGHVVQERRRLPQELVLLPLLLST